MTDQNGKPAAGYRDSLVYQQEYSSKLITLMIGLRTRHLIERPAGLPRKRVGKIKGGSVTS